MSSVLADYDGLVVVVKEDCPTCTLIAPVLAEMAAATSLRSFSQDNPKFPDTLENPELDAQLEQSYKLGIETVPTLIRFEGGEEKGRAIGWERSE